MERTKEPAEGLPYLRQSENWGQYRGCWAARSEYWEARHGVCIGRVNRIQRWDLDLNSREEISLA